MEYTKVKTRPAPTPDMKRAPIETLATDPKTIMALLGGIIIPMSADEPQRETLPVTRLNKGRVKNSSYGNNGGCARSCNRTEHRTSQYNGDAQTAGQMASQHF